MLNLNCVICAELFGASDDVHVTPCGHLFHITCLRQWLERSKSCPQCRNKCTERSILRVYFNLANLDISRIDVGSLQEQLDNANLQLKMREKETNKYEKQIKELKETQKKCLKTIAGLEQKIQKNEFVILSYTDQIKLLKTDAKVVDELRKEVKTLKQQINLLEGVSAITTACAADAERLLKNENDPQILSVWVTTLKRELRQCENKKTDLRNTLKVVQSDLRKELDKKRMQDERILQLESENYQLNEKVNHFQLKELNAAEPRTVRYNDSIDNNSIGLNNNLLAPLIKEERRTTISPTIKENIKRIEESKSPYFNIKASSVGLTPMFTKTPAFTFGSCSISPIKRKTNATTMKKTTSDLSEKYSIFKKPRLGLSAATMGGIGSSTKPLSGNYAFNGFGGSEKIDPFARDSPERHDEEAAAAASKSSVKNLKSRLKAGELRNLKISK